MAGAGALHRRQRVRAGHVGEQRQPVVARHVGEPDALELALRYERELGHGRQASTSMPRERRLARREQRLGVDPVLLPVDAQPLVPVQKQRQTGLPAERPVRDHPRPGDLECARLDVDGRQRLELAVVPRHVEVRLVE